ncbi:MAG: class E sortase [Firmicutes bacterium]|nr:class E sortase [Bacillota bacterium]
MTLNRILKLAGLALTGIAVFILVQAAYTDIYAGLTQKRLRDDWSKSIAKKPPPTMTSIQRSTTTTLAAINERLRSQVVYGKPFARLVIPKINLDAIVLEGVSADVLAKGPGHMEGTAYPGEIGNVVISGHRVTYSRPFFDLDKLTIGDPIYIYALTDKFTYRVVEQKVVKPTEISVTDPTPDRTLTLTTCNPRFSAKTRLIIVAKMQ